MLGYDEGFKLCFTDGKLLVLVSDDGYAFGVHVWSGFYFNRLDFMGGFEIRSFLYWVFDGYKLVLEIGEVTNLSSSDDTFDGYIEGIYDI